MQQVATRGSATRQGNVFCNTGSYILPYVFYKKYCYHKPTYNKFTVQPVITLGPIILAISVGLVYWNKKELEQGVLRYESKGALFAVLIERAKSGPMLVKYSLNLLAMFSAPDTCSFSLRKYAGNVDLPFFLFNMSFNVSQVFLISPLYLVNSRA